MASDRPTPTSSSNCRSTCERIPSVLGTPLGASSPLSPSVMSLLQEIPTHPAKSQSSGNSESQRGNPRPLLPQGLQLVCQRRAPYSEGVRPICALSIASHPQTSIDWIPNPMFRPSTSATPIQVFLRELPHRLECDHSTRTGEC
jgi:hypothetical protein